MCVHRLYIYSVCGHSIFSQKPEVECLNASVPPGGFFSTTCDLISHPYQSWRIATLCPTCEDTRRRLVKRIENVQAISFDEAKWKVSYGLPKSGPDYWGRKAQERERLAQEAAGKEKAKNVRFSFRRRRRSNGESVLTADGASLKSRN